MPTPIKSLSFAAIYELCEQLGQPKYRADQLIQWLFVKQASSYDEMTNLPKAFREALAKDYPLIPAKLIDKQISNDGTRKYCFELADGARVESVGIPVFKEGSDGDLRSLTVCFSTQVGCPMACAFCATGTEGLTRDLSSGEMVDQVAFIQDDFNARVSHVVSMGQGEPFLNYDATIEALDLLNSKKGFGIGARHITVSTCGIIPGIERLAEDPHQYTLAVSLHSAEQVIRDMLMPRCSAQTLPQLKQALQFYQEKTGRRVSFEYLMINGVNDTDAALESLIEFSRGIMCHVNLIPLNDVDHSAFKPSSKDMITHWKNVLTRVGIETTIRNSRGSDIDGACGQLKNKLLS
ncbi:23S rRNA (adenine(2503)-C(2))-methyltransferase RlmN [Anaerotardibacter muris]|uniref:23S rRNA (adenine(2503)-C(2))-methyltransferase RlmN n=1 Tax=Anaerotardibacter muris TaxID=2941505 RepID=UPI00203AEA47|nr:23S rRNA (adenine(2503)-C(2))-methyltransferase RlmN [Anaerotardibacter muris]